MKKQGFRRSDAAYFGRSLRCRIKISGHIVRTVEIDPKKSTLRSCIKAAALGLKLAGKAVDPHAEILLCEVYRHAACTSVRVNLDSVPVAGTTYNVRLAKSKPAHTTRRKTVERVAVRATV